MCVGYGYIEVVDGTFVVFFFHGELYVWFDAVDSIQYLKGVLFCGDGEAVVHVVNKVSGLSCELPSSVQ